MNLKDVCKKVKGEYKDGKCTIYFHKMDVSKLEEYLPVLSPTFVGLKRCKFGSKNCIRFNSEDEFCEFNNIKQLNIYEKDGKYVLEAIGFEGNPVNRMRVLSDNKMLDVFVQSDDVSTRLKLSKIRF